MIRVGSNSDRLIQALRRGPKTGLVCAELLGVDSRVAIAALRSLVAREVAEVIGKDGKSLVYRLRCAPVTVMRGADLARAENAFRQHRSDGLTKFEAANALGLTATAMEQLEKSFRCQTTSGLVGDSSSPKFANDAAHLAALSPLGGFPVLALSKPKEIRHAR